MFDLLDCSSTRFLPVLQHLAGWAQRTSPRGKLGNVTLGFFIQAFSRRLLRFLEHRRGLRDTGFRKLPINSNDSQSFGPFFICISDILWSW
jgi:hypothetical protein